MHSSIVDLEHICQLLRLFVVIHVPYWRKICLEVLIYQGRQVCLARLDLGPEIVPGSTAPLDPEPGFRFVHIRAEPNGVAKGRLKGKRARVLG
ncbi:hypothetical protein TGAMA5MH_10306 [Trichoderma gamsii]|uniref:Uncharacterized protein n=1 Tax=Trichoderma gamsii TaxID=398673 RepID=A0A2K0SX17_9HYPO|nr:hypothetical protein TGAMA5MH_10306 [Trichoderma gamsii]